MAQYTARNNFFKYKVLLPAANMARQIIGNGVYLIFEESIQANIFVIRPGKIQVLVS